MTTPVFATTKSLTIRAFRDSDLDPLVAIIASHDVQRTGPRTVLPKWNKTVDGVKTATSNATFFAVVEYEGQPIGQVELWGGQDKNRDASFGIVLGDGHRDKGFGTEVTRYVVDYAFMQLGLHRVSLGMMGDNPRAYALYKKTGFVEEGRKRKAVWQDGAWVDMIDMGILYEDWAAARKVTQ
ncbi:acyl-CoA N-acyltransferase [Schizophyllum amplum]|uniref:Acyl-CoA N-acyltransferase n=1 Tax=Schizophyllum amplum TaxID=97359 RepID=A0A550CEP3_9AGAR|nr:acyl-CoA N-acyltransferase [Auriculariopsis ampla]